MLLTWSSAVIGLATLTVIGTVLPFSTNGGMSSLTLPVCIVAVPTTVLIAEAMVSGVAPAGRRLTTGIAPIAAALPASLRKRRRVGPSDLRIVFGAFLFAQRCKIRHNILDLLG